MYFYYCQSKTVKCRLLFYAQTNQSSTLTPPQRYKSMLLEHKVLLAKCLTLLHRERLLGNPEDSSAELVRTALKDVTVNDNTFGLNIEKNIVNGLKAVIFEQIEQVKGDVDLQTLLQQLRITCENDDNLYDALQTALSADFNDSSLRKSVVILRRQLDTHFREKEIADEFRKTSAKINFARDEIKDLSSFVNEFWTKIEPLTMMKKAKDPAIIQQMTLGNNDEVRTTFRAISEKGSNSRVYKTLWNGFNKMTQGGLRVQCTMHHALPHRYKTGANLTLFSQVLRANKPFTAEENKIPCMVRISFEDETDNVVKFLFLQMKFSETREYVEIDDFTPDEILNYVTENLEANGWKIILLRVNPTEWSYKDVFNFIISLEAEGYAVEGLWLDYLGLLPTTGCIQGAQGEALRDMLRRFRNFCMAKGMLFMTPHQMSTEAKNLLRGTTTDANFVKDVAERGYAAGSKQLDNELDLEFYQHIAKIGKVTWLAFQRGKHRIPTIVDDVYKYFALKFTHPKMPIPDDRPEDPIIHRLGSSSVVEAEDQQLLSA